MTSLLPSPASSMPWNKLGIPPSLRFGGRPQRRAGARRPTQQEHCRRPRHQAVYDREPSRRGHEEDRLALSSDADSLGARRRPRHRVAISPLTEKRRSDLSRGSPSPIGPIRSRGRPGLAGSSAFSMAAGQIAQLNRYVSISALESEQRRSRRRTLGTPNCIPGPY